METKIIEATDSTQFNHGKFLLGRFTEDEWARKQKVIDERDPAHLSFPLLRGRGWDRNSILVLDLQTGEGAIFRPGGMAKADLDKHRIWV